MKSLPAILRARCPKCREGKMFCEPNPYRLKTVNMMPNCCAVCKQKFIPEPGFYFGAAYVSYGLTVALWVAVWVALHTFGALGWIVFTGFLDQPEFFLLTGVCSLIVTLPPLWRLSRVIWIYLFVEFDENRKGSHV